MPRRQAVFRGGRRALQVHDHGHEGVFTLNEGGIGDALFNELRERPRIRHRLRYSALGFLQPDDFQDALLLEMAGCDSALGKILRGEKILHGSRWRVGGLHYSLQSRRARVNMDRMSHTVVD